MLSLIPRILMYKFYRKFGFPKLMPMNFTVSVTNNCNSRCSTCNIYKKKGTMLTVDEYGQIFKKIGYSPFWVTLSGGEPFLRADLVEIAKIIYLYSKPRIINIPSNGILTDKIVEDVTAIAKYCKKSDIIINLSIDAIGTNHDKIRNVNGNYEKVIETYNRLKKLKIDNLSIGIHTVISNFNVNNFAEIANRLMALKPDSYITEIAERRVELGTMNENITPPLIAYKSAIDYLIHRIKNQHFEGTSKITQAFRIEYYNLVKRILRDKTQIIPCYAGIASVQISPEGDVWPCCIKAVVLGNLKDCNFDFRTIFFSRKAEVERRIIKNKGCYCPLANASYTNMLMDIPTLVRVFYRSFIKWWN
ncbi:MAG: radical SAM/SPASM domain-containing protein [Candidatus Cloacimonetes bacterium]|nr:radical SAM/SPASM domain-containing protein [Candidatus Cloacimonadota bacterium]